jgi:predicted Fe-S protein YdhL (DUF1289 family)
MKHNPPGMGQSAGLVPMLALGMSRSADSTPPAPPSLGAAPATSPCIKVCQLDLTGRCYGCGRSRDEIARWSAMSFDERRAVNTRIGFTGHGNNR